MKFGTNFIVILRQTIVVLAFFAGMILNYYAFLPALDEGETAMLEEAIGNYTDLFYECSNCDPVDSQRIASIAATAIRPFGGDFLMMDRDGNVIYSTFGASDDAYKDIEKHFGTLAVRHTKNVRNLLQKERTTAYDKHRRFSYYAKVDQDTGILYFYAADYRIFGHKTIVAFRSMLVFMLVMGVLVIVLCMLNVRKFRQKVQNEFLMGKELETAASIQKSMLPKGIRHFMQIDLDARLLPAKKVGGDFYSYRSREGYVYFCIGDVSGKGVPASLFMSRAVALFRSCSATCESPAVIASMMNEELCSYNDQNMFLTAFIGRMRLMDGFTEYVNAGHEPPVVWNGNDGSTPQFLVCTGSVPLGVMSSSKFEEGSFSLDHNGLLFLYTDGISEARGAHARLLGRAALLDIINTVKDIDSSSINDYVIQAVRTFESGSGQSDDITLLTFRNIMKPKVLEIRNEIKELRKLPEFTDEIFRECPLDSHGRIRIRSALDEAVTNCVSYAYDTPGEGLISISATLESRALVFTVTDSGREFNPLEYTAPDIAPDERVGGLGISMFKSTFDIVEYERREGNNILKLIKKL